MITDEVIFQVCKGKRVSFLKRDVLWFAADNKYTQACTHSGIHVIERSLSDLKKSFQSFVSINRQVLAAPHSIEHSVEDLVSRSPLSIKLVGMKNPIKASRRNLARVRLLLK